MSLLLEPVDLAGGTKRREQKAGPQEETKRSKKKEGEGKRKT